MAGPITFEVVDLNCEQADRSFFVPAVTLTGKSTSSFATLFGYSEFGIPSSPPKKYRTITWQGFSQRVAFTAEQTPRQCAGAGFLYSGVGQVDLKGKQISNYSKKFFAQCAKQTWPLEPIQANDLATRTNAPPASQVLPQLVGFCWPELPSSCPVCDPNPANWSFLGEQATNNPIVDLSGFMHALTDPVVTKTSTVFNSVFQAFTSIEPDAPYSAELFGTDINNYSLTAGALTLTARATVTTPPVLNFPPIGIKDFSGNFVIDLYVIYTDTANYSAVLTDEYTDAMAAANATVVVGTGLVAQNLPRTTGFTTVTTNVVFTLQCTNLISGTDYTVTVDFWDQPANTHTTKTYPFTADSATHTIIDSVPTPAAGHTIQVRTPKIAFA